MADASSGDDAGDGSGGDPESGDPAERPLEPGSPSLEHAAFVLLGMAAALVVWLLLLP